jgi:hypothetical protein
MNRFLVAAAENVGISYTKMASVRRKCTMPSLLAPGIRALSG